MLNKSIVIATLLALVTMTTAAPTAHADDENLEDYCAGYGTVLGGIAADIAVGAGASGWAGLVAAAGWIAGNLGCRAIIEDTVREYEIRLGYNCAHGVQAACDALGELYNNSGSTNGGPWPAYTIVDTFYTGAGLPNPHPASGWTGAWDEFIQRTRGFSLAYDVAYGTQNGVNLQTIDPRF